MNVINILKLRDEEIKAQEITTVKHAIYAVGKRKSGALPLLRYTDLFFPSYLRLFFCNLTLLSNKQEGPNLTRLLHNTASYAGEYISSQLKFQSLYIIAILKL